jgi:hypothetical protein
MVTGIDIRYAGLLLHSRAELRSTYEACKPATGVTDWARLPETTHRGESGTATARVRQCGEIQLRLVEYSADYVADHWCHKGHIVFVVAGRLTIEHQGASSYTLTAGKIYQAADDDGPASYRERGYDLHRGLTRKPSHNGLS